MSAPEIKPHAAASRPRGGIARFAPLAPAIRLCAGPSQCAEYTLCQKRFPIRYPFRIRLEAKIPLYAQSGIEEVWLVDIPNTQIRCYKNPTGDRYMEEAGYTEGNLQPRALPEIKLILFDVWRDLT